VKLAKISRQLMKGSSREKIELLSHLNDIFESYNPHIADFDAIIGLLVEGALKEGDPEVRQEFFETLVKAGVFRDIRSINLDKLVESMESLSADELARAIDVLSFTHNRKYLPAIERHRGHENPHVREAVATALQEMGAD
jgi:hypothetical protein